MPRWLHGSACSAPCRAEQRCCRARDRESESATVYRCPEQLVARRALALVEAPAAAFPRVAVASWLRPAGQAAGLGVGGAGVGGGAPATGGSAPVAEEEELE